MEALVSSVSGYHGFILCVDMQLAGRGRMSTRDHIGNFYGPGLEVAYISSPHIPFLPVLKVEQSTVCLTTQKTKSFLPYFASPDYLFPILFTAKLLKQEEFICFHCTLYSSCNLFSHFLTLLKVISDLLIIKVQSSHFPFDSPSLHSPPPSSIFTASM